MAEDGFIEQSIVDHRYWNNLRTEVIYYGCYGLSRWKKRADKKILISIEYPAYFGDQIKLSKPFENTNSNVGIIPSLKDHNYTKKAIWFSFAVSIIIIRYCDLNKGW